MYMAKHDFHLKPSRIRLMLHTAILAFMLWLWCASITLWLALLLLVFAAIGYVVYRMQAQPLRVSQLDADLWTIQYVNQSKFWLKRTLSESRHIEQSEIQHIQLQSVLDHSLYILFIFNNHHNVVIWCDQVSKPAWKQLKILAKIG